MKYVLLCLLLLPSKSFTKELFHCKVTSYPNVTNDQVLPNSQIRFNKIEYFLVNSTDKKNEAQLSAHAGAQEKGLGRGKLSISLDSELVTFEQVNQGHFFEISKINHGSYQGYISIYSQYYYEVSCKKMKPSN